MGAVVVDLAEAVVMRYIAAATRGVESNNRLLIQNRFAIHPICFSGARLALTILSRPQM
jgi:hypothetical protein